VGRVSGTHRGSRRSGRASELFTELRRPQTGGACTKFFTGSTGPTLECVRGFGEQALAARGGSTVIPKSDVNHSRSARRNSRGPVPVTIGMPSRPDRARETSPLAGLCASPTDSGLRDPVAGG
jgi:hypothetical protein